jgi:pectin methylesterase-like acyl-CoA thioesterase
MARLQSMTVWLLVIVSFVCLSQAVEKLPETREEVVADFENWVKRVGEKHAAFQSAAKTGGSAEELASKLGERVIVVDQSGAGNFKTINEALASIDQHNKAPITIKVNAGTYV